MVILHNCQLRLLLLVALAVVAAQAMETTSQTERNKHHRRKAKHVEAERAQSFANPAFQNPATRKLYHTNQQLFTALSQLARACPAADMTFQFSPEPAWHYALEALGSESSLSGTDVAAAERHLPLATFNQKGADPAKKKKVVLLNFGFHGRELVAAETALRTAQVLCGVKQRPTTRSDASDVLADLEVDQMLEGVEVNIVPIGSPTAREEAQHKECQRTNIRGEDLNRNWPIGWEAGDTKQGSDTWRGSSPLSSYESAALADLAEKLKPDLYMDVHSGAAAMSYPFAKDHTPPVNAPRWMTLMNRIKAKNCLFAHVGTHAQAIYTAQGTSLDYMYTQGRSGPYGPKKQGVPHAFLWEIYGGDSTVPDCQTTTADQQRARLGLTPRMGTTGDRADLEGVGSANLKMWHASLEQEEQEEMKLERESACFVSFNPRTDANYERVVGHWSSAILDLVSELQSGRM